MGTKSNPSMSAETIRFLESLFTKLTKRLDRQHKAVVALGELMARVDDKITAFAAQVNDALAQVNTNLENVVADEQALAKQIADLQAQIANDPGSDLSPESQALLDGIVTTSASAAAKTKQMADSVPDSVTPPPV